MGREDRLERDTEILFWRRTDVAGLERMVLRVGAEAVTAEATILCLEDGGFELAHRWRLTPDWRALSVQVEKVGPAGRTALTLERVDGGWAVDGTRRAELDGTDEPDLSVTPFCNTLPIRRMVGEKRRSLTLETCYVDAASMTVARSRQRYDRLGPARLRYVDLGLSAGFEADLEVDERGLVIRYEHLFERVAPL
ncbi:hypothetical protein AB7M35_003090 [Amorphus suaedae]